MFSASAVLPTLGRAARIARSPPFKPPVSGSKSSKPVRTPTIWPDCTRSMYSNVLCISSFIEVKPACAPCTAIDSTSRSASSSSCVDALVRVVAARGDPLAGADQRARGRLLRARSRRGARRAPRSARRRRAATGRPRRRSARAGRAPRARARSVISVMPCCFSARSRSHVVHDPVSRQVERGGVEPVRDLVAARRRRAGSRRARPARPRGRSESRAAALGSRQVAPLLARRTSSYGWASILHERISARRRNPGVPRSPCPRARPRPPPAGAPLGDDLHHDRASAPRGGAGR